MRVPRYLCLGILLSLPACWNPSNNAYARWDLLAVDGVPATRASKDRLTFYDYGDFDHRYEDESHRHGTLELEDDNTGEVLLRYDDGITWNGHVRIVPCPDRPGSCRNWINQHGPTELRAPGY